MKLFVYIHCLVFIGTSAFCQGLKKDPGADDVITRVKKAQLSLETISYKLARTDTFTTGEVRTITGTAQISIDKHDTVFGFKFQAKRDGVKSETVYDGRQAYATDDDTKTYILTSSPAMLPHILGSAGGQVIITDLVKLDTSKALNYTAKQDDQFIYLTLNYADLKEYDVSKRCKTVTINKDNMLPVAVRSHQETLGKVQDLYFLIKEIRINQPAFKYDFSSPWFLASYRQQIPQSGRQLLSLKDKPAPAFMLATFANSKISSTDFKGKVILLDFWEVWCGPCVESMPKIQRIYDTYKNQGLQVYGIINDTKQLEPSKLFVVKRNISYPMLVGNEQLEKDYKVNAVPLYVLINKKGNIIFLSEGYSDEMESAIKKALADLG